MTPAKYLYGTVPKVRDIRLQLRRKVYKISAASAVGLSEIKLPPRPRVRSARIQKKQGNLNCNQIDSLPQMIPAILRFVFERSRHESLKWNRILPKPPHSVVESKLLAQFPGSSTVEHSAVNRRVASSNLARGAIFSSTYRFTVAAFTASFLVCGGRLL
jgi:hypothetical protein